MRFRDVPLGGLFWANGIRWFKVELGYALPLIVTHDRLIRTGFKPGDTVRLEATS